MAATLGPELRKVVNVVDRLVEVRRLKEIVVLRGFSRLGAKDAVPPDITRETGWLPAVALRGEGIFFTLEESVIRNWAGQRELEIRAEVSRHRCEAHWMRSLAEDVDISPRFILLHTLAHAIIRTLEAEAGYPAASLKERIYSASGPDPLAGYVAVPDEVGSLGGLVEMAEPKRFGLFGPLSIPWSGALWIRSARSTKARVRPGSTELPAKRARLFRNRAASTGTFCWTERF